MEKTTTITKAQRRISLLSSHFRFSDNSLHVVKVNDCVSGSDNKCVFCKVVRGETPAFKLYEDEVCMCILDMNPVSAGHSLIIPKSHYSSLQDTPPSVVGAMCSKVTIISNAVMKATGCCSFNLLVNNGAAAGQVIFHTHLHIIPRKASDCLWTSESLRRRPLKVDHETHQFVDQVCKELSNSDNPEDCQVQGPSLSAS